LYLNKYNIKRYYLDNKIDKFKFLHIINKKLISLVFTGENDYLRLNKNYLPRTDLLN